MKILVIGDSCTDIFVYGDIKRVCPEAPVPVFNPTHQTKNGGMAKNVATNLEAFGCDVDLVTNSNDIQKIRYVDNRSNQLVLRVDEHDYCDQVKMLPYLLDIDEDKYDAIVISDYNKGFLDEEDIKYLCNHNNVFIDTKKQFGEWILNADYIKINEFEHKKNYEVIADYPELEKKLITTQGSKGCFYNRKSFSVDEISVRDVSGAGDTFLAGLVYKYVKSKDIYESIKFAQKCACKVISKKGVVTI